MKKKSIFSIIGSVMVIMVASRLLSLFSSQVYMSVFGTDSIYINIYSYVINIPNIIFTCVGTALSTVVIPLYVGHIAKGEREKAKLFADNIITVSTLLTSIIVIAGIAFSPLLVNLTAFSKNPEAKSYAVKSLMIVMPVMFFYAWNYIFQGMLQAEGKFKLPAFVSVPSSLVVILYVIFLSDKFGVTGLMCATCIGLMLQALILIPPLFKGGYRYRPRFSLKDPDIISAGKMTVPVLIGVGAYQLNMLFNSTMIARFDAGMVTIFTFVQNITVQLVLAFTYSVTAVIYPKLSESYAKGDMQSYKDTLGSVLKTVSAIFIPLSFGFICVREPLLNLLVSWGKVSSSSVEKAEIFLVFYAIGILAIGFKEILDRALYSVKNTKISGINGFLIMIVNIVLSLVFIKFMGAYGIPLAYSLASFAGILNLLFQLRKKAGSFAKGLGLDILKSFIASVIMSVIVLLFIKYLDTLNLSSSLMIRLFKLFSSALLGALVYFGLAYILKVEQIRGIISKFTKRFSK